MKISDILGSLLLITAAKFAHPVLGDDMTVSNSQAMNAIETQITHDGYLKSDLVYWPGTNELLYTVEHTDGNMRIVRCSESDQTIRLYHDDSGISDRELAVSADGQVVAHNSVSGLSSRIRVVDKLRNRTLTMPQMGKHGWANWPTISPDGSRLVFVEGAKIMYAFDLVSARDKESITRLTPDSIGPASDYWPRFTPDGQSLVFGSSRDDDFEIYVMNSDGTNVRRLTKSPGIDMHPACSPNGQHICFTSNRDGNHEIYAMNIDGSGLRRVTNNPERDDFAIWSPNGDAIDYVSERAGRFDIWRQPITMSAP